MSGSNWYEEEKKKYDDQYSLDGNWYEREREAALNPKTLNRNILPIQSVQPIQNISPVIERPIKNGIFSKAAYEQFRKENSDQPEFLSKIGFVLESPYRWAPTQRLLTKTGEFIAGKGSMVNGTGKALEPMSTGNKIADTITDVGANLFGSAFVGPGNGTNLLNATDDVAQYVGNKVLSKTVPKLSPMVKDTEALMSPLLNTSANKLLPTLARGAVDAGVGSSLEDFSRGENLETIGRNAVTNAAGGAALFGAGKVISELLPKKGLNNIKKSDHLLPSVNQSEVTFNGQLIEPKIKTQNEIKLPEINEKKQGVQYPEAISTPMSNSKIVYSGIDEAAISQITNIDDIDNTLKKINDEIAITHEPQKKAFLINLKLLGEAKRADLQSRFRSNTIARATALTGEEKALLKPQEFDYVKQTSEEWAEEAAAKVNANLDSEMNRIKRQNALNGGVDAHEAALISIKLRDEARQTGNYNKLLAWLKTVAEKTRETARALKGTDTAWEKKSVDGAIMDAARTVDNVEDSLKKTNPKLINDIDKETKTIIDSLDNVDKQVADVVTKEIDSFGIDDGGQLNFLDMASKVEPENLLIPKLMRPETAADKLAKKIENYTKPQQEMMKAVEGMDNEEKTMLRTLFNIAKGQLPDKPGSAPMTPEDLISAVLRNKDQYYNVWAKAKQILKEKYRFDDDRIEVLSGYLEKKLRPVFEQNQLNKAISTELKARGINLADVVKQHYSVNSELREDLTQTLIQKIGLAGEQADYLAKYINNRMKELTKQKKEQVLRQMFRDVPKIEQKNFMQKIEELINLGAYENNQIRDLIKEKKGLPVLTKEDINFIAEHMEKAKSYAEGSYENRMELSKVYQLISNKEQSTGMEKLQAAQRMLMLLNPKSTIVRNPLGNTLLNGMESLKNIPAAGIDKAVSALRGSERTTILNPLTKGRAAIEGAKTGFKEWASDIANGVNTSSVGGGVELPSKTKIFNESAGNPVMRIVNKSANKVHGIVGAALRLGDTPFYNAAYSERLAELRKIKKTDTVTDAMKEDAVNYALERTLQNDSALAALFTGIKGANFLNNHPGAKTTFQLFSNLILPFAKTPANVMDKFIDYSPAGSIKAIGHAALTAGKGTFNQKKFVDTLARSLTGTGLAVMGYLLAKKGLVTGSPDSNNKVAGIETALGKQDYAFRIGDTYQTIDWALPAAAPLMMGADIYNSIHNIKDGQSPMLRGTESAVNLLFNSTLMQGPSKIMGGYSPAASLGKGLLGTTTQITPVAGKQIAQLLDPMVRDTYDPNAFKQSLNKLKANVPGLRETLPVKVDIFGNDVKAYQGNNNAWNVLFNPGYTTTFTPNNVQKEIIRLYDESGQTKQLPLLADKVIPKTKKYPELVLNSKEVNAYQKRIGELTTKSLTPVIESPSYKSYTDEEKADLLRKYIEKAKENAKIEVLKNKGVSK